MEKIKVGTLNAPTHNLKGVLSSLPTDSVFIHDKDSDFQQDRQYHPCTYCVNWTICLGYTQWKECKHRIMRKGVLDE